MLAPFAATLNVVAVAPFELVEKTQLELAETLAVKPIAKLEEEVSIETVIEPDDQEFINPVCASKPPEIVGFAFCTTKLDEVVTVTPVSALPTAFTVTALV